MQNFKSYGLWVESHHSALNFIFKLKTNEQILVQLRAITDFCWLRPFRSQSRVNALLVLSLKAIILILCWGNFAMSQILPLKAFHINCDTKFDENFATFYSHYTALDQSKGCTRSTGSCTCNCSSICFRCGPTSSAASQPIGKQIARATVVRAIFQFYKTFSLYWSFWSLNACCKH